MYIKESWMNGDKLLPIFFLRGLMVLMVMGDIFVVLDFFFKKLILYI